MLIGLVGFAGSGKDTVGDLLEQEHGYTKDSFARPLKDAVAMIFGWDREAVEGTTPESRLWREVPDEFWSEKFGKPFSPRLALQLMGTEAGRNVFHQDVWVISLLKRAEGKNIVVTDVRFKNEIAAIRDQSGLIVRVKRGEEPLWYNMAWDANHGDTAALKLMKDLGVHQSEWDWIGSDINITITNDGSLSDLRDEVSKLAKQPEIFLTFP